MAFYSHNPFLPQQRQQAPYGYGHPFYTASAPNHHYSATEDFDVEEQAALAHLASIRQRREAAELVAHREAVIRAQVIAQREAAIAAAAERERLREQTIRRALAIQEERRVSAQEQYRHEELRRSAVRNAQQEAYAARALENRRRTECARRCAGSRHRTENVNRSDGQDWKQINDVLGSLFGISLAESSTSSAQTEDKEKDNVTAQTSGESVLVKVDDPAESVPAPPAIAPATTAVKESVSAEPTTPSTQDDHRIVTDLSDLASKFLGINIAAATADETPTAGADALAARVNDFLRQFGLEFEPVSVEVQKPTSAKGKEVAEGEKPARPASSTRPAQPAQPKAPVDDSPAATPAAAAAENDSAAALTKLRDISHELHLATESFTFPSQLAFAPTPSADEVTPPLLFNKSNSGYHAQAHKLLQLLLAADGVSSGGDKEVRRQRKAIVRAIEGAIEKLEQKRDQVWSQVKERRSLGEESDDEGSVSSWATESVHEAQHIENAASPSHQESSASANSASHATDTSAADETVKDTQDKPETVEGFEVPVDSRAKPVAPATEEGTKNVKEDKDEFELV